MKNGGRSLITLLENLSYPEVEAYLKNKDMAVVPVGSVEQHSPFGLLGTDFITAESVARRAACSAGVLVCPTINYGVSPHHMAFAGTMSIKPATLIALVEDVTASLLAHGFRRVLFINGHGGNVHAIAVAVQNLKYQGVKGIIDLISWYEIDAVRRFCKQRFSGQEGHHATPGEVSITRYARPDAFEAKPTSARDVAGPDYYWPLTGDEMRTVFPDGRMESAPWLATGDLGKEILEIAAAAIQEKIAEILKLKVL
jgi:creatinine amidohydrolase